MITKAGSEMMEKIAFIPEALAAATGYIRADKLTKREAAQLRERHGLDDDANLKLRNAGRGVAGAAGGGLVGGYAAGQGLAYLLNSGRIKTRGGAAGVGSLAALLALGSTAGGAYLATNKYSKGAVEGGR